MPEAGWLLLLLFLGACSLIVVAVLWPSFRRIHDQAGRSYQTVNEAHAYPSPAPRISSPTPIRKETPSSSTVKVRTLRVPEWLPIVNERPDEAPHTLIIGTSGAGKTTLAQALANARTGRLAILDPKWTPGRWGGLPAVAIDDSGSYTQIEAAIKALLEELTSRLVSLKQGTTEFEDLIIIAEELPTLVDECPSASTLFKKIGRTGRELRIRLIGLSQSERVKSLGIEGEGDAKDNYTLIRLGKTAIGVMAEARSLSRPAVLEWRGEYFLLDLGGILQLSHLSTPPFRSWAFTSPEAGSLKQTQEQGDMHPPKEDEATTGLLFSAGEVRQVIALILRKTERGKAIRAMPRYTRKQHKVY